MVSSYKGLYVQRTSKGQIHSVQVEDPGGNSIPLEPTEYIKRDVKPPINELPDIDDYQNGETK
jgi:hypothetical protein